MQVEAREFRDVAGLFATGVTIVVGEVDGQVHAMTANSVTSVSLEPPLMLFCPSTRARIAQQPDELRAFTINILRREQQPLSSYFAGGWKASEPPPFRFVPSPAGPRLEGALAAIGCHTEQIIEAGDHYMVLGRVVFLRKGIAPHRPLVFLQGKYRAVDFTEGAKAPDLARVEDEPPQTIYQR